MCSQGFFGNVVRVNYPSPGFSWKSYKSGDRRATQPNQAGGWGKAQEAQGWEGVGAGFGDGVGREGGAGLGRGVGRGRWREGGRCGAGFGAGCGGIIVGGRMFSGRFCAHRTGARFPCVDKSIRRRRNYPASSHNQEERHIRRVSRKVS